MDTKLDPLRNSELHRALAFARARETYPGIGGKLLLELCDAAWERAAGDTRDGGSLERFERALDVVARSYRVGRRPAQRQRGRRGRDPAGGPQALCRRPEASPGAGRAGSRRPCAPHADRQAAQRSPGSPRRPSGCRWRPACSGSPRPRRRARSSRRRSHRCPSPSAVTPPLQAPPPVANRATAPLGAAAAHPTRAPAPAPSFVGEVAAGHAATPEEVPADAPAPKPSPRAPFRLPPPRPS